MCVWFVCVCIYVCDVGVYVLCMYVVCVCVCLGLVFSPSFLSVSCLDLSVYFGLIFACVFSPFCVCVWGG
eukprot:m.237615 g.237615  ORF g.237615 m.237615 type:complete len:70 (-) comp33710_c2_seq5:1795-2004(-)